MKTKSIPQHKVDGIISTLANNESLLLAEGIDADDPAFINDHQLRNYAETICNELVSELEHAGALIVTNDQ